MSTVTISLEEHDRLREDRRKYHLRASEFEKEHIYDLRQKVEQEFKEQIDGLHRNIMDKAKDHSEDMQHLLSNKTQLKRQAQDMEQKFYDCANELSEARQILNGIPFEFRTRNRRLQIVSGVLFVGLIIGFGIGYLIFR